MPDTPYVGYAPQQIVPGGAASNGWLADRGMYAPHNHVHPFDTWLSGQAIKRVSDSNEYNTASTSAVDMVTLSGFTIAALSWTRIVFHVRGSYTTTSYTSYFGLKVNGTLIADCDSSFSLWHGYTTSYNGPPVGTIELWIPPRQTNYDLFFPWGSFQTAQHLTAGGYTTSPANPTTTNQLLVLNSTAANNTPVPNAAITSIALRGWVQNAAITRYISQIAVYEISL
jgi:hypothetical protein